MESVSPTHSILHEGCLIRAVLFSDGNLRDDDDAPQCETPAKKPRLDDDADIGTPHRRTPPQIKPANFEAWHVKGLGRFLPLSDFGGTVISQNDRELTLRNLDKVQYTVSSSLEMGIAGALRGVGALGVKSKGSAEKELGDGALVDEQVQLPNGVSIDFVAHTRDTSVLIETDGPTHYVARLDSGVTDPQDGEIKIFYGNRGTTELKHFIVKSTVKAQMCGWHSRDNMFFRQLGFWQTGRLAFDGKQNRLKDEVFRVCNVCRSESRPCFPKCKPHADDDSGSQPSL